MAPKKKRLILVALSVVLLASAGLVVNEICAPGEPRFEGRPLHFWLHQYHSTFNGPGGIGLREEAIKAVREVGTNAVPTLLTMLCARDSNIKVSAVRLARKLPLIKIQQLSARERNFEAEDGFVILGSTASQATPALIQIFNKNISPSSQGAVAEALGAIGAAASNAVPALLIAASNSSPSVRFNASLALGLIQTPSDQVVPALVRLLFDSDTAVRIATMRGLADMGTNAIQAVPALLRVAADRNARLRGEACVTLGAIRCCPKSVVPAVIARLGDPDPNVRKRAAACLGSLGGEALSAVPELLGLRDDNDAQVRAAADLAVASIRKGATH